MIPSPPSRRAGSYARFIAIASLTSICTAPIVYAQGQGNIEIADDGESEIVVTAQRLRGAVETDIAPLEQLNEGDIAAVGASSITDLLAAIAPQTSSGRGRGSGEPVVLINGQRVSGFRELRDIPPEAIRQVQIFPEELSLQYGYRPDQRVINFILKDNFASFNGEIEGGSPQRGGYVKNEFESTFTTIGKSSRFNLNAEFERQDGLTEAERGIVEDSDANIFEFDGDLNQFRSLLPASESFDVNGSYSRAIAPQTNFSLNANYRLDGSVSLLGLPSASLILPGSSPFSPTGADLIINQAFNSPRPLERESVTHTANFGFSFNSLLAGWRWALSGDYSRADQSILTIRNADFTTLQAGLLAGTVNPFATDFGDDLAFLPADRADSLSQNINLLNSFTGALFDLPAGPVQLTFKTGFTRQMLDSLSETTLSAVNASLRRDNINGAVNIDLPLVERDIGALGFLGEIALNGNYGISDLSDFGRLSEYTAGIRWSPAKALTFSASLIGDENAPNIAQLGSPVQILPNVSIFDFTRGETTLVNIISGGNPALIAEKRRDLKLSLSWEPQRILGVSTDGLNLQAEYFRNRSRNTSNAFPLLTPEIEAAFADRVVRGTDGRLVSVDRRPVNYAEENAQSIRWGFNFSGAIGEQRRGGGPGGGRPSGAPEGGPPGGGAGNRDSAPEAPAQNGQGGSGGQTQNAGSDRPRAAGGPPSGGRGAGPGRRPGRWQLSLFHTYQLEDEILVASGIPKLDLLNGSATSSLGGTPRHRVELSGGLFNKGLGMRVSGNYRGPTRADGTGLRGSSDLRFSDLASIDLRFFVNLDERGNLTKNLKFLKGSRIAFRIDNILNDVVDVRDENGLIPLSYQPAILDPNGRYFEISFRKIF
ncbi:TonB-dependent receptor [Sphingorhabdus arenilitoris]|uniref:TonB-dependent receptor n=1 Tax=Sphingorhabdus arenilitoris TaxID=1490041 RepID=A0ABV8RIV3_9SPHN